ncbi:putative sphingosine N-acyltransferase [Podospora fimiseda]|uniref:Sphingosine N-acyltransferase n=1 Tax=Podospora fimiseda TaxID=252190 RepID=A0AAN7BSH7_9PEZI|nr:putative sphingosine N-acyltransferase [Podospora fimiseda]
MSGPSGPVSRNGPDSAKNASSTSPTPRRTLKHVGKPKEERNENVVPLRRCERKNDGPMKGFARWFVKHQIGLSFNLLALLFLAHGMPRAREHTSKYFTLSYYNPQSREYGLGANDSYLVAFFIVLFTLLRAATMEYVLAPFARSRGIAKQKDVTRFSEQAWLLLYYTVFWPLGVYIYRNSPSWLNLTELWTNWPNRELPGLLKGYILAQFAFWLQQLIVIHIEDRRKDHWQMFSHHIVTSTLIFAAYRQGYVRVGNLILVLMDVVDIFLPVAKCLKYMGFTTLCDVVFALFMISWVIARHILYMLVCWSIWDHIPKVISPGCYYSTVGENRGPFPPPTEKAFKLFLEPLWDNEAPLCFNETVQYSFLAMLLFLQGLTVMWFCMILRVAVKVIRGGSAEDSRSDDEADEVEDEDDFVLEEAQPLEQEVGVGEIDLKNWERRTRAKRTAAATTATGVSLPGHSDRKELLGRIGCEKQVE